MPLPGETRAQPSQISTRRKVAYTALMVVAMCGAVEGMARLVWWRLERASFRTRYEKGEARLANDAITFLKVPDRIYGYTVKPGLRIDSQTTNSQGFRQRDDVLSSPVSGSLRIVCLGESTTFGTDDDVNYPTFLGNILNRYAIGYQQYEVINAGVPGWSSDQVALRVHHQIAALEPDVAILYVGWNDFQSYDAIGPVASVSTFDYWFGGTSWMEYVGDASRTVALLSALWTRRPPAPIAVDNKAKAQVNPADQRYRFLLRSLTNIVRDLRAAKPSTRIFVCTLVGIWPQTATDGKAVVGWVVQHRLEPPQTAHFLDELNDQLKRFARAQRTGLIDLAATFGPLDRRRLQFDFAHMKKDGYELMAWAMTDALHRAGLFETRQSDRYQELLRAYGAPPSTASAVDR
jgi:lysophospholipase L1-like esterase